MASKFTYLRVGLATSLSLALGGPTVASVFAEPAQPVMPSQALFQDDDGDDDGSGAVSGVWDPTPRPVSIHTGTIAALGDDVAELNSLVAPDGQPTGSDDRGRAEYGYTPQIPFSLDELTGDDHVIIVELSELNDSIIAYGHIGGVRDGNGSLVVNLVSSGDDDDDGSIYGIAVLTPNASNPGTTDASIFIAGSSLGDDIGSRVDDDDRDHDNDGRDDDDADGDGIRDDDDDDDDDDGRLDDDDDDDDGDGRTDDDNDDDRDDDGDDEGQGGDDGFDDDGPGGDDGNDDGSGGDDDDDDGSDDDGGDDTGDDDSDDGGGDDDGDDD